ncbi:MAG TPA: LiaF domain-containing protein [Kofleriaceae bacterium]
MTDTNFRVLLGSAGRRGAWTVPSHIDARITLGSMELDLREADLGAETTIDAHVTFGSLEIIVPDDVVVDVEMSSLAASVANGRSGREFAATPARRLRVIGSVRFASCEVISIDPRGAPP